MTVELLTGLGTGADAFDALITLSRIVFTFFGFVFIATCWFFIARRTDTGGGWLAFLPIIGMIVPWRVAQAPRWTLIVGMLSAILFPVAAIVFFVSIVLVLGIVLSPDIEIEAGFSFAPLIAVVIVGAVLMLLAWASYLAITGWWAARAAKSLGFSLWVGLFASPLTMLIPLGFLVRLVFVGILAFRKQPF